MVNLMSPAHGAPWRFGHVSAVDGSRSRCSSTFARPDSVRADGVAGLASHRAIYDLALTRAAEMDGVRAAKGSMVYALTDQCEGYTVESNLQMELAFANGNSNQVDQRYAAWEAKDGRTATFRMQVLENGLLTKSYHGAIALGADGAGTATYETDAVHTFKLPKGTLLSTAHTLALLKSAAASEKALVRPVIDGSFEEGPFTISAVISPARSHGRRFKNPPKAKSKATAPWSRDGTGRWSWPTFPPLHGRQRQSAAIRDQHEYPRFPESPAP